MEDEAGILGGPVYSLWSLWSILIGVHFNVKWIVVNGYYLIKSEWRISNLSIMELLSEFLCFFWITVREEGERKSVVIFNCDLEVKIWSVTDNRFDILRDKEFSSIISLKDI